MQKQPLVTIITVVYNLINSNREDCFKQCLESVHNQSYDNIEHIIVDGASEDGTLDLIKEYANKGWIKYISEPDSGLYDAMNKGATLAQGEYLAFMNSDDFYSDLDGIAKCIDQLTMTNADFSYAKANILGGKKGQFKKHEYLNPKLFKVYTHMPFSHQTLIVKKEVFEKFGKYDLTYKSASDYDFILKMVLNGCSSVYCKFFMATFRLGGFSLENSDLSNNEIASFYQKYYGKYHQMSHEDAKKTYLRKKLPFKLILKIVKTLKPTDKILFLLSQYTSLRRELVSFRFSKIENRLKLFRKKIF